MAIGTTALLLAGGMAANAYFQNKTARQNAEIAERNRKQALLDRAHIEQREDSAVQRRVLDMQKAGLSAHGATSSVSHAGSQHAPLPLEEEKTTDIMKALLPLVLLLARKA